MLYLLVTQKEITRSDVENTLNIGTTHTIHLLKNMLEKGLIIQHTYGKLTRYVAKQ